MYLILNWRIVILNNIEEKNYNDRNNKSNNDHRTKHISANNVDLRKFYLNYNHLNTIGVYESTVSQVNTDEEDAADRRSKYRLIDKNKINKSLNNTNFKYKKFNRSLPNIELDNLTSNNSKNENEENKFLDMENKKISFKQICVYLQLSIKFVQCAFILSRTVGLFNTSKQLKKQKVY